ncbi:MAG: 50S ribosomal protein L4 [Peptoanaerobacter stomatis]|uniref:50S ribosomal protein L4 n=1 Tax=Peptoanaerobacter stomatis TaxID=796937 RepID=UPI003F9F023A
MPKIDVLDINGNVVEQMEISEDIFAVEINEHCVYETVKNHLANRRQGTQSAKTRAEVRGGGRKPWRQKGTGRARQGSTRSPQWIGGGVVFAPKPRDYSYKINKKVKRIALKSVLTDKVNNQKLIVLNELTMNEPKTKVFAQTMKNLKIDGKKALFVTKQNDQNVVRSGRNIYGVSVVFADVINTYDIINHEVLVMTKDAVIRTQEVFA